MPLAETLSNGEMVVAGDTVCIIGDPEHKYKVVKTYWDWWNENNPSKTWYGLGLDLVGFTGYPAIDHKVSSVRDKIEIYREVSDECDKCRQTAENCECHIPDEEKHSGLYNLVRSFKKKNYALLQKFVK